MMTSEGGARSLSPVAVPLWADPRAADPVEVDRDGLPWVPRCGGRVPLGAELDHVARTGAHGGRGRSEARMAVLAATAASGWRLADVRAAVACGALAGQRGSRPCKKPQRVPAEAPAYLRFARPGPCHFAAHSITAGTSSGRAFQMAARLTTNRAGSNLPTSLTTGHEPQLAANNTNK